MSFRTWSTLGGLAVAAVVYWLTSHFGLTSSQSWTAAVTSLCMTWWVCETIPTAATAMVPLVVFPFVGVLKGREVAIAYGDPVIMLFLGAFMASKAVEHWGAHRRIAHAMMARIGATSGPRILLALMVTTTLCSFWINNTSVALMMLPVALALIEHDKSGRLAVPLLLGVAYTASIGGIATPIGTAPNGVFQFNYAEATGHTIPFGLWMIVAGSVAILLMLAAWVVFAWSLRGVPAVHFPAEGHWTKAQIRTLIVFGLAALAWITQEVPFGGWGQLVPHKFDAIEGDMVVAVLAALVMFFIPSGEKDGSRLLDWKTAATIPWGVLILFGGGLAIAAAFKSSGLSEEVGNTVKGIQDWPQLAVIGVLCLITTFLSEVTSNTATANILMPILASAASTNGIDPVLLMFPATLANSLAFMMPVGTPPNALVYGTGRVRIIDMVRYGFVLNLIGVVIVTLVCWQMLPLVFGVGNQATAAAASGPVSDSDLIVPGERVGDYVFNISTLPEILGSDSPESRDKFAEQGLWFEFERGGVLKGVTVDKSRFKLANGLRVGSRADEVESLMGKPDGRKIDFKKFVLDGLAYDGITFFLDGDVVAAIRIGSDDAK